MKNMRPIALLFILASLAASTASAQTNLAELGSNNFTLLLTNEATVTQTATNLTSVTPQVFGGTFGGQFSSVYTTWTNYSDTNVWTFGLFMRVPGANPNVTFTVELFNDSLSQIINAYQGSTESATAASTFIPVLISSNGTGDFSTVGGLQLTWNGGGSGDVVIDSVAVVPEPTTWALLGVASLVFGLFAWRRRLAVARR
jgi:hypothetical protein